MSINIKNREAEALLGEIKVATGKGTTELLLELLRTEAGRQRQGARHRRAPPDAS
jgi:hypothetical protein